LKTGYPITTLLALYDPDAIGTRTLASFVQNRAGLPVHQIFFKDLFPSVFPYTPREMDLLIHRIRDLGTELLGISLRSSSWKTAAAIIQRVRKEMKEVRIVIGGTHAILAPEECIELADMVCLGEGEIPLLELIRNFTPELDKVQNIHGLWVKTRERIYRNPIHPLIDLDELPVIDYSHPNKWFIEDNRIEASDPLAHNTVGEVFASRGCPYHCTYCNNPTLKSRLHKGRFVRLKSVDQVIDDIHNLQNSFRNLKKIVFADEVFALNRAWASEFCRKYRQEVGLPFAALFHPDVVREETLTRLKEAGLTHARMGIQSGSESFRKEHYRRNETDERIIEAARLCHRLGIRVTFDIIVNNPYETEEDLKKSLRFYLRIPKPFELNMHSLVYFPKTELTERAVQDGIIQPEHVEGKADEALRLNHVLLKNKKMIYGYENNLFWNSLFSLTSKSFVPRGFIHHLSKNKSLRKKPGRLLYFAKLFFYTSR